MDWDLFRTFDAVARLGSMTAAARSLGISQSTVTRHLQRLEAAADTPLLVRGVELELTMRGSALLESVAPMVLAATAAAAALEEDTAVEGEVSVTSVGEIVRWTLVPALPALWKAHPKLRVTLLSDNRVASLASAEADLAVRFLRPTRGDLVAQRIAEVSYGLFVGAGVTPSTATPWLGLAGSLRQIPEDVYAQKVFTGRPAAARFEDVEALAHAVAEGFGVAVLPRRAARRFDGLRQVSSLDVGGPPLDAPAPRSVWLVAHRARQRVPKVRATQAWLLDTFSESR